MAKDQGTYDTPASKQLSLDAIIKIMQGLGAANIYVKELARNDNSKNQIYLGGNLSDLSFIPSGEVVASATTTEAGALFPELEDGEYLVQVDDALGYELLSEASAVVVVDNAADSGVLIYVPVGTTAE